MVAAVIYQNKKCQLLCLVHNTRINLSTKTSRAGHYNSPVHSSPKYSRESVIQKKSVMWTPKIQ